MRVPSASEPVIAETIGRLTPEFAGSCRPGSSQVSSATVGVTSIPARRPRFPNSWSALPVSD